MQKKMVLWAMVLGCFVLTAGAANAATKKNDQAACTVESVEGNKVVLNCTEMGKDVVVGAKVKFVKVKAAAKPAATEPAKPAEPAEPAKPAAAPAPAKAAEPATPATPAKPAPKKKIEGC